MPKLFVSNKDETIVMFSNRIIEKLSRTHWSLPIIFHLPIIGFLFYLGFAQKLNIFNIILLASTGLITWTLVEYSMHRFIFHYDPKSSFGKRIHWLFHGVHHDYPQDSLRLVMPVGLSYIGASIFFLLFSLLIPKPQLFPFFGAFLFGYLTYDISHYAMHHFAFKNKLFLKLKQHHMKHHYKDPNHGYGVSSPIWDKIFGTVFEDKKNSN